MPPIKTGSVTSSRAAIRQSRLRLQPHFRRHRPAAHTRLGLRLVGDQNFRRDQRPATAAAFCRAERMTLVGSTMPALIMSQYSPVCALKP